MKTDQPLSLLDRITHWASHNPEGTAIYCNGNTLTFGQLQAQSAALAHRIVALDIASPFIGLSARKTMEPIVGILAIIKAAKAYLPLDPAQPRERLAQMITDSGITHVVCESDDKDFFAQLGLTCLSLSDTPDNESPSTEKELPGPGELVALLYTSGSTGVPKGVCVTHLGMHNIIEHQLRNSAANEQARILSFSHLSFDVSFQDIFMSLNAGATLYVIDDEIRLDTMQLLQYLEQHEITMADLPYVTFQHLCEAAEQFGRYPKALKEVTSGGELIKITPAIRNFFSVKKDCTLVIAYGPTECSVSVTDLRLQGRDIDSWPNIPPIGRPVANTIIRLLDDQGNEVPTGEIGEIHVAGISLAKGYLNREELTAERFIYRTNPDGEQERLYNTGDLGVALPTGEIVFHGRTDNQVKIRGNRVELGEIEACLADLQTVSQNVVVVREDVPGIKRLVAYVIPTDPNNKDTAGLRSGIAEKLPKYMMPDLFVWMDAFPKTTSGKVDRKALPMPDATRPDTGVEYRPPNTENEKLIATLWQELFMMEQIGIDDNFFELGGNSLLAMRVLLRIEKERAVRLPITALFRNPTIEQLAAYLEEHLAKQTATDANHDGTVTPEPPAIVVHTDENGVRWVPTIDPQREIWMASTVGGEEHNVSYNLSVSLALHGAFNLQALNRAFNQLMERHESMRTRFNDDGSMVGIQEHYTTPITAQDISALPPAQRQQTIAGAVHGMVNAPFDLAQAPLFRVSLFKLRDDHHYFTLVVHHILADGWSLNILLNELIQLYREYSLGQTTALQPAASLQEYLISQHAFYQSPAHSRMEQYWLNQYRDALPVLNLPTDSPRTNKRSLKRQNLTLPIDPALFTGFKQEFAHSGGSIAIGTRAVLEILLARLTRQYDIVTGMPIAGHISIQNQSLVAQCVNILPLRARIDQQLSFREYLALRRQSVLEAYENDKVSFVSLARQLKAHRSNTEPAFVPVFFDCFDWDNKAGDPVNNPEAAPAYEIIENNADYNGFDFFINVAGSASKPVLQWSYNTGLFRESSVMNMMQQFVELLDTVIAQPDASLGDIAFSNMETTEGHIVHGPEMAYETDKPFTAYISEMARLHPQKTAIRFNGTDTSYQTLEQQTNQLANYLVEKGVTTGDIIGVSMDRSVDMVIALIGVAKAGAAYIPLDPQYPASRVEFMLQDAEARFLLTEAPYSGKFHSGATELLYDKLKNDIGACADSAPPQHMKGHNLAYILYTSGSTGKPKGVQIKHHNLANFLLSMQRQPGMDATDTILALTTISFDIAELELLLPLISGATMILADSETRLESQRILDIIKSERVTVLQATPATWRMMLESGWNEQLPIKALCGGEAFPTDLAEKLLERCQQVWNVYGPTETTVWSTIKQVRKNELPITVGIPIANTQVHILDEDRKPVAPGREGEIYIGGHGVALGYLNRPELTADRFVLDPCSDNPEARIYGTGDLGKILSNGEIQCLGRIDTQVKIRGFRIELGEIEYHLNKQDDVKESVVIAREDRPGDQRLVAYILPDDNTLAGQLPANGAPAHREDIKQWKKELLAALPPYMVPNDWVMIPEFPLTPNKKIDRKALPKPPAQTETGEPENAAEVLTPNEKRIFDIWTAIFKSADIRKDDNFFELGGHSLLAVEVMNRIEKETGIKLPLASLFDHPTIEQLAILLEDKDSIKWNCLVPIKTDGTKPPLYLIHGAGMNVLVYQSLGKHLNADQPLYALQAIGLDGKTTVPETLTEIAAIYVAEIVKQNPEGPYALAGYSLGGVIAYEMARQLLEMDCEVVLLGIMDTNVADHENSSEGKGIFGKIKRQLRKAKHIARSFRHYPGETLDYQLRALKRINAEQPEIYDVQSNEPELLEHYGRAYDNYNLQPLATEIHLFRVNKRIYFIDDPVYLGWKPYALKGVTVYPVPGDHKTFLFEPNDRIFANTITTALHNALDNR